MNTKEHDLGDGIQVRAIKEDHDSNGDPLWGFAWKDECDEDKWSRRMPTLSRTQLRELALWLCSPGNPASPHGERD